MSLNLKNMEVLIVGKETNFIAFRQKFSLPPSETSNSAGHSFTFIPGGELSYDLLEKAEVVFDFNMDEDAEALEYYKDREGLILFCNAPKISLAEMAYFQGPVSCVLIGFNGLPSLFDRPLLEVSLLKEENAAILKETCQKLNTAYCVVEDRVGMVTPRVLCMIINEAFYTLMEGTATIEDIDLAMKLGTSYPYGPFEFAERIGYHHVYEILEAVYEDTKDERYKICPLLKKKYLGLKQV